MTDITPSHSFFSTIRSYVPTWAYGCEEAQTACGLYIALANLAHRDAQWTVFRQSMGNWLFQRWPMHSLVHSVLEQTDAQMPMWQQAKALASVVIPTDDVEMAIAAAEYEAVFRFLEAAVTHPAQGLAWLATGWELLMKSGDRELVQRVLGKVNLPSAGQGIGRRLYAEFAFHYLDEAEALEAINELDEHAFGLYKKYLLAMMERRTGDLDSAAQRLKSLVASMPWHTNLLLLLHDLENPLQPVSTVGDDVCILLYSWNKADLLEQTLESVGRSSIGDARIVLLDNGSSDHMPEVFARAEQRFGQDRCTTVRLPVNIGAPGARSWLLKMPQVQSATWAAFLDDDVIVPENWLAMLLAGAGRVDRPGAVGCRITAPEQPYCLQSADYHVFPPDPANRTNPDASNVNIHENTGGQPDTGSFAYNRVALHVSGCCHLLSMESVRSHGGFDIRFSPTQFDDLDRDLRLSKGGYDNYYVGELAIRHIQHSSLAKASTPAATGNVLANRMKLEHNHPFAEISQLAEQDMKRTWDDLDSKLKTSA